MRRTEVILSPFPHFSPKTIAWVLFCLSLTACEKPMLFTGHFEGTLTSGDGWQSGPRDGEGQKRISIDVESKDPNYGDFQVKDIYQKSLMSIFLSHFKGKSLVLEIPEIHSGRQTLKRQGQTKELHSVISDCYRSDENPKISLCLGAQSIFLSVQDQENRSVFSMKAGRLNRTGGFVLEEPRILNQDEALERVLKSDFESVIEFEQKFQAIERARAAELNLIPHFRFINAVALLTMAPPLLIISLNDWVPFLFPIHWVRARKERLLAESEKISYEIIRANLILQTQTLIYAYQTHLENLNAIDPVLSRAYELQAGLKKVRTQIPDTVLDAIQSFILSLETNKANLGAKLTASRISLAETLGFLNPQAVLGIQQQESPPQPENQPPLAFETVMTDAIASSLELRQLDFLLKANRQELEEICLAWTHPDTNPETQLGFNLIPQIRSQRSKGIEILAEQEQRRQKLIQSAFKAVSLYNSSIIGYQSRINRRALERKRLDDLFQAIETIAPDSQQKLHLELYSFQLGKVAEEYLASEFELERHLTRFQWARSWVDRLTFVGPYAKILEELES